MSQRIRMPYECIVDEALPLQDHEYALVGLDFRTQRAFLRKRFTNKKAAFRSAAQYGRSLDSYTYVCARYGDKMHVYLSASTVAWSQKVALCPV